MSLEYRVPVYSPNKLKVGPAVKPAPPLKESAPVGDSKTLPGPAPDSVQLSHRPRLPKKETTAARTGRKAIGLITGLGGLVIMAQAFFSKGWAGRGFQAIGVFLAGIAFAVLGASIAKD